MQTDRSHQHDFHPLVESCCVCLPPLCSDGSRGIDLRGIFEQRLMLFRTLPPPPAALPCALLLRRQEFDSSQIICVSSVKCGSILRVSWIRVVCSLIFVKRRFVILASFQVSAQLKRGLTFVDMGRYSEKDERENYHRCDRRFDAISRTTMLAHRCGRRKVQMLKLL